ncbi:MAG TPA: hypothetical protein DCP92_01950 [Nitrospiraceae bacterium]|jgi:hypothetical protein|nr:hypothetical protein [Nitrospiraceae bacterium]
MNRLRQIDKRIEKIKQELTELGELRPGSLSKQYNVCGKATCKCKDPEAPQRHGPYYQISYGRKGKSSSAFVRLESLADVKKQLANLSRGKTISNRKREQRSGLDQSSGARRKNFRYMRQSKSVPIRFLWEAGSKGIRTLWFRI